MCASQVLSGNCRGQSGFKVEVGGEVGVIHYRSKRRRVGMQTRAPAMTPTVLALATWRIARGAYSSVDQETQPSPHFPRL